MGNRKHLRRVAAGVATVAAVAAIAGGSTSSAGPVASAAAPVKVQAEDNFFDPRKAVVGVGGKVKWKNTGRVTHNVTFGGGGGSGNFGPGESYVRKFGRAGKFPYVCTLHPGMAGKVKVVG